MKFVTYSSEHHAEECLAFLWLNWPFFLNCLFFACMYSPVVFVYWFYRQEVPFHQNLITMVRVCKLILNSCKREMSPPKTYWICMLGINYTSGGTTRRRLLLICGSWSPLFMRRRWNSWTSVGDTSTNWPMVFHT